MVEEAAGKWSLNFILKPRLSVLRNPPKVAKMITAYLG
jgi:hypothetical protein